jgi:hypothetical protein
VEPILIKRKEIVLRDYTTLSCGFIKEERKKTFYKNGTKKERM